MFYNMNIEKNKEVEELELFFYRESMVGENR